MAIEAIGGKAGNALGQTTGILPRSEVGEAARADRAGQRQSERARLNGEILTASLEVSIRSGNEPLQLTFRSVIDNLNEILKPDFGADAIQNAASQDNSPEGTAGRIVALSTGFFEAFAAQRPEDDPNQVLDDFLDVIGRGIAQGFAEARDILDGLGVLQGDIASNIDRTEELVQQGLAAFAERVRRPAAEPAEAAEAGRTPAG